MADTNKNDSIAAINGTGFTQGQVVLVWSGSSLIGIDQVDNSGHIKVLSRVSNPNSLNLKLVETGTLKTVNYNSANQTATASSSANQTSAATAASSSPAASTMTNSTGMSNSSSMSSATNSTSTAGATNSTATSKP